jgi:DNA primase
MGQRGPIDRFRNRLTWPIRDISGDVVGFGARKLASDEEDQGPKYLNTPETPIYKKSQVFTALMLQRKRLQKSDRQ